MSLWPLILTIAFGAPIEDSAVEQQVQWAQVDLGGVSGVPSNALEQLQTAVVEALPEVESPWNVSLMMTLKEHREMVRWEPTGDNGLYDGPQGLDSRREGLTEMSWVTGTVEVSMTHAKTGDFWQVTCEGDLRRGRKAVVGLEKCLSRVVRGIVRQHKEATRRSR